jgi:autotransporter-associated beta strand protein
MSNKIELGTLIFAPGAPSYTITGPAIFFRDKGVRNASGVTQTVACGVSFRGHSRAGDNVIYTGGAGFSGYSNAGSASIFGAVGFEGQSSAANATIITTPGSTCSFYYGIHGKGTPSAGNAHITVLGGDGITSTLGAYLEIDLHTILDHGTFIAEPASVAGASGATIEIFADDLTGGTFIANGGDIGGGPGGSGGTILVQSIGNAGDGTYTINGATAADGASGVMSVQGGSAGSAFITLNGGTNGGRGGKLTVRDGGTGGTARLAAYGNGSLSLKLSTMIGSIEGDGLVDLSSYNLAIGSNNLNTTFSGTIQDSGSISKIGTGTLTLTGASTYTGGTTVSSGVLLVSNSNGSGTGTGAVSVDAGTLGGSGIISGAVTLGTNNGTGAFLAPSEGSETPATLAIQGTLTLNGDSTYSYQLNTDSGMADQIIAHGAVIGSGATFSLLPSGNNALSIGQVFTVINNTAATSISGTFQNLADGTIVTVNGSNLQASYSGGDGNDLTLTVVP